MVLIAIFYGTFLLMAVADDLGYRGPSYEKLLIMVFKNDKILGFAKTMMVLLQLFKVVGHNLFIIKVVEFLFCKQGSLTFCKPRQVYVLVSFLLSAPTYLVMNISFYSYISLFSVLSVNSLIICLWIVGFIQIASKGITTQLPPNFIKLPMAYSLMTHSLNGIGMVMPIRSSMEDINEFKSVQKITTIFVFFLYCSTAIILALAFGQGLDQIAILSFPKTYTFLLIFTVIFGAIVFLTYPLHLFPIYTIFLNSRLSKQYLASSEDRYERGKRIKHILYAGRLFCLIVVYSIVLSAPDFVSFLGLIGSLFATTFIYVFPILMFNRHFSDKGTINKWHLYFNWIILGIMIIIAAFASYDSISHLFKS